MMFFTAPSIEGRALRVMPGMVLSEAKMLLILVGNDLFASITNLIGSWTGAYESKPSDARRLVKRDLEHIAKQTAKMRSLVMPAELQSLFFKKIY